MSLRTFSLRKFSNSNNNERENNRGGKRSASENSNINPNSNDLLGGSIEALSNIDPFRETETYLYILNKFTIKKSNFRYVYRFAKELNPARLKNLDYEIRSLGNKLDKFSFQNNNHICTIKILKELILKYQTTPNHLTSLHHIFAKQCLLAKTYDEAEEILKNDIDDFEKDVNVLDFMLYHYYGGMLACGLKNYHKAFDYFQLVITSPAVVTSQIMIESYKKYVLVSILLYGMEVPLPKYTANCVKKVINKSCQKYKDLSSFFTAMNLDKDYQKKYQMLNSFETHQNNGLIFQCKKSLTRKIIQQLTKTYVTMSLSEIAKEINMTNDEQINIDVESQLLSMINDNQIFAKINQQNGGMISFYDNPELYNDNKTLELINEDITKAIQLSKKVVDFDRTIHKNTIKNEIKENKKNMKKISIISNHEMQMYGNEMPIMDTFRHHDDDDDDIDIDDDYRNL